MIFVASQLPTLPQIPETESLLALCFPKGGQETGCRCAPSLLLTLFGLMTYSNYVLLWVQPLWLSTLWHAVYRSHGPWPSFEIPEIYKLILIREGPSESPIVAPSLATFSSFFARHKICVRAESNVGELCARALFILAMKKEDDVTNNTELLVCVLSRPFKANKKRVMLHSLVMHLSCQGAICGAAGVALKPCRSRRFCTMTPLNLSFTHSQPYLLPKLLQPFLICFSHTLLYKDG